MKNTKKQLAKIYYQNREVQDVEILFDDEHYSISIGVSVHISGKAEIITMDYDLTKPEEGKEDKELSVCQWEVKDYLDKVQVIHTKDSEGVIIEWLSPQGSIKSSLFIPMRKILHIITNVPLNEDEDGKQLKEVISR